MLMIVQAPNAFATRWLELEHALKLSHDVEICHKDARDERLLVFWPEDANQTQHEEVGEE